MGRDRAHRGASVVAVTEDTEPSHPSGRGQRLWRAGTAMVILLCGALFITSGLDSQGADLRPGRFTDLADLVADETDRYEELQSRVGELEADINRLSGQLGDADVERIQEEVEVIQDPAGLTPRFGPGVTVTLKDAPPEVSETGKFDDDIYVVHQQDIQAVVNAMWRGGATAVTVAGQRIVSTTGIKCEGSTVQLEGIPYSQPFVIQAVGPQFPMLTAIGEDPAIQIYRDQAARPDVAIGWEIISEANIVAPAYDGLLNLTYATPMS